MSQKRENLVKSQKVIFQKLKKLLTEWAPCSQPVFRAFKSHSFNVNGWLRNCYTGFCLWRTPSLGDKQFLWFLTNYLLNFTAFFSFWLKQTFFLMYLIRRTIYVQMIHLMLWIFFSVTLKKRCFLTLSVCMHINTISNILSHYVQYTQLPKKCCYLFVLWSKSRCVIWYKV